MAGTPVLQQHFVPQNESEAIGLRVVQAFNERNLEAGIALAHPDIIGMPSRVHGAAGGFRGHAGLREWARTMLDHASTFEVLISSMRLVERRSGDRRARPGDAADRARTPSVEDRLTDRRRIQASKLAMFGDICLLGEPLSSWAALLIIEDGLVIRHRSYLSSSEVLEEIGILDDPLSMSQLPARSL